MDTESILVPLLLALATLPLVVAVFRVGRRGTALSAAGIWVAATAAIAWASAEKPGPTAEEKSAPLRPLEVAHDGFVTSKTCQACHPREYDTWYGSYHRTMTQVATPETVVAPWDGTRLTVRGREYVFLQDGDEFFVEMDDPDWTGTEAPPRVWKQVVQITGSHVWQYYWYATRKSRKLAILLCAYRIDAQKWLPLDGCCLAPPRGGQASGMGRWSLSCNRCHSTHPKPRVNGPDDMDTHVVELGIACEACHGPAEEHVAINRDPRRRYDLHLSGAADASIVNPAKLDKERSSLVCGNCHANSRFRSDEDRARFNDNGLLFRPGGDFEASREFTQLGDEGNFWSDGVVRIAGREFTSLLATPCFTDGEMSCLSCHTMHKDPLDDRPMAEWADDQLKPGMRGNAACTQCHDGYGSEVELVSHTHHRAGSSGSNCNNCHMPHTTYGLLKATRDHQIGSPSVAATLATGRPNACNQCHLDKSMAWAAEHLSDWYGLPVPPMTEDQRTVAMSILSTLEGDAGERALMAWSFGWDVAREVSGTDWMTPYLVNLMNDPYHPVRYIAERSFEKQPEHGLLKYDYMDAPPAREAGTRPALEAWMRAFGTGRESTGEALLIGEDGALDEATYDRLLAGRDNHPVLLKE